MRAGTSQKETKAAERRHELIRLAAIEFLRREYGNKRKTFLDILRERRKKACRRHLTLAKGVHKDRCSFKPVHSRRPLYHKISAIVATHRTKDQELLIQQGDVEDAVDSGSNMGASELAGRIDEEVERDAATDTAIVARPRALSLCYVPGRMCHQLQVCVELLQLWVQQLQVLQVQPALLPLALMRALPLEMALGMQMLWRRPRVFCHTCLVLQVPSGH